MPEGPQVRRVGNMISRYAGRSLVRIEHPPSRPAWDLPLPATIESVETKGKNIFIRLAEGPIIYNHMLMWGSWRTEVVKDGPKRLNTAFIFDDGSQLGYYGGGILKVVSASEAAAMASKIGPDVLTSPPGLLMEQLMLSTRPIGETLLEQSVLSGVGNIYKSEGLFAARLHPELRSDQMTAAQAGKLVAWLKHQMNADVTRGGITTTPPNLARQGVRRFVYRRRGQPCLFCGTKILRIEQGSSLKRSTYYCPACQSVDKT